MRLTIRTKLLASFGLVLTLSTGAGMLAYVQITPCRRRRTRPTT